MIIPLADGGVEIASKDTLAILYFLLPGLITAAIYYSLTAHPKKETFERVVQALIFTVIIKTMNIAVRKLWWMCWHPWHKFGLWTDDKEIVWSVINAVVLGVVVSTVINWDAAHSLLRKIGVTKRTSYPSEWYSAFHRLKREVVLYLKDERRVRGWAEEYPDQCDRGHFLLQQVKWLDDDGNEYPQDEVEATMIAATDVQMVQFLPTQLKKPLDEVEADKQKLINFRKKKEAEAAMEESHDAKPAESAGAGSGGDEAEKPKDADEHEGQT